MMYITPVWGPGLCTEDLWRCVQPHTWSSIIIVTSLTLGPDMIDGVLLMTLGWNCYYHKSDTPYLKRWSMQLEIDWKEHGHLSTNYCVEQNGSSQPRGLRWHISERDAKHVARPGCRGGLVSFSLLEGSRWNASNIHLEPASSLFCVVAAGHAGRAGSVGRSLCQRSKWLLIGRVKTNYDHGPFETLTRRKCRVSRCEEATRLIFKHTQEVCIHFERAIRSGSKQNFILEIITQHETVNR